MKNVVTLFSAAYIFASCSKPCECGTINSKWVDQNIIGVMYGPNGEKIYKYEFEYYLAVRTECGTESIEVTESHYHAAEEGADICL